MKYIILAFSFIVVFASCTEKRSFELPEHIKEIENLTVYDLEDEVSSQITFQEEQAFGNDESQLNGLVGSVRDVTVDNSGRVYIADPQETNIKVYELNGQFLTTLGRGGQGPGEMESLASIQIKGNDLYVLDRSQQRIVVFSLDSLEYDETINIADNREQYDEVAGAYLRSIHVKNDGSFLTNFSISRMPENIADWEKFNGQNIYYFLGSKGDIVSQKLFETESQYEVLMNFGGRRTGMPVEYFGKPMTSLSNNDNIVSAWSQDFLVKVYSPEGEYERAFYYPIKTVPLEPELAFNIGNNELIQSATRSIDFPDSWPVMNDLLTDDENRMWVSTIVPNYDIYEWWILDESGELITQFEWPRDEPIELVKNGYIYTRKTVDETGLQQIVRYGFEIGER